MCPFEDTTMIGLANQDVKDFIQVITIQKFFNFRSDLSLYKTIKNRSNVVFSVSKISLTNSPIGFSIRGSFTQAPECF